MTSRVTRVIDGAAVLVWAVCIGELAFDVARAARGRAYVIGAALLLGYVATDLISGIVHWIGDTWGTARTPLIGGTLIRGFREHHEDPTAITRHGFLETNGANCLVATPLGALAVLISADAAPSALFVKAFLGAILLWTFWTNQFHKWAHVERRPAPIRLLQRLRLVLPPEHHARHHAEPFTSHYCITTGWLNAPLAALDFFPRLERAVQWLCAAEPRRDESYRG